MDGITMSINAVLKNIIKNFNTLLDCPVRFSGEYDGQKVHNFIEYIEYYKRVKCIADDQALQELQYLLLDQAHDWWLRRKPNLSTWSEALTLLENRYSKKRPAYAVYTDILKSNYGDYGSNDDFIDDKIELFNELSQPGLKEESKLEVIYALLPNDIQNKVKLVNINSIKELKEHLKLTKSESVNTNSFSEGNTYLNTNSTPKINKDSTEIQITRESNNELSFQSTNNLVQPLTICLGTENNANSERDPIIKVRRTEDLMRQDIKEEEMCPPQQEKCIANDTTITNNMLNTNQDDFQIDNDIMNQINNIIDESEMHDNVSNNQVIPTIISQPSNRVASLELLGFHIETNTIQPERLPSKSPDHRNNSSIKATKKVKIRCSYCRYFNHTAQACFKRAKHTKLYPERFVTTKTKDNSDILQTTNSGESMEPLTLSNISSSNISTTNGPPTEPAQVIPLNINQISSTTTPCVSFTATAPTVTSSSQVILNSFSEKCINSALTTKLIAPINGKTSNKILAAKLRSTNSPSPKCHQCGTVGFYKSICPNCSPIYNTNYNHV